MKGWDDLADLQRRFTYINGYLSAAGRVQADVLPLSYTTKCRQQHFYLFSLFLLWVEFCDVINEMWLFFVHYLKNLLRILHTSRHKRVDIFPNTPSHKHRPKSLKPHRNEQSISFSSSPGECHNYSNMLFASNLTSLASRRNELSVKFFSQNYQFCILSPPFPPPAAIQFSYF